MAGWQRWMMGSALIWASSVAAHDRPRPARWEWTVDHSGVVLRVSQTVEGGFQAEELRTVSDGNGDGRLDAKEQVRLLDQLSPLSAPPAVTVDRHGLAGQLTRTSSGLKIPLPSTAPLSVQQQVRYPWPAPLTPGPHTLTLRWSGKSVPVEPQRLSCPPGWRLTVSANSREEPGPRSPIQPFVVPATGQVQLDLHVGNP